MAPTFFFRIGKKKKYSKPSIGFKTISRKIGIIQELYTGLHGFIVGNLNFIFSHKDFTVNNICFIFYYFFEEGHNQQWLGFTPESAPRNSS